MAERPRHPRPAAADHQPPAPDGEGDHTPAEPAEAPGRRERVTGAPRAAFGALSSRLRGGQADADAEPPPEFAEPSAAAFFDLDNTLMQGAAIYHLARGLYAHGFFTKRDLARFAWQQAYFRLAGTENPDHMASVEESALGMVRGHRVDELRTLGEEVYDQYMADRIWSGTLAIARRHLAAGQRVWLVTAAPEETASIVARRLGLTGALGTVSESREGVYTGRLVTRPLHGPEKAAAIRALAGREGFDLGACSAYSDSVNDLPMLSSVGHPCVVNPDRELRQIARERGWRVRDFRTARRAATYGVPAAGGLGLLAGGVAAGAAIRRRYR